MSQFYLLGDMGSGYKEQYKVSEALQKHIGNSKNRYVCGLGDNMYPDGCEDCEDKQFIEKFELPYKDISDKIKFYMLLGNHDYHTNHQSQIDYSNKSNERDGKWIMPSRYYNFQKPTIDFFVLDTNFKEMNEDEIQEQFNIMKQNINKSNKPWKVVMGHHTWRSIAGHGNADPRLETFLTDLLMLAPFDIYTCGHDHNKQVISRDVNNVPITMIVCGSGGKIYDDENNLDTLDDINDLEYYSDNLGYAFCKATPKTLTIEFLNEENIPEYKYQLKK